MFRLAFILAVCGWVLAAACGGGSSKSSPTPGASTPAATATSKPSGDDTNLPSYEADLKDTAVAFQTSILKDGAVNTYRYFSRDFKQKCSLDEFLSLMAIARVFLGDLKDADVKVEVTSVRYEGAKAFVDSTGTINGDELKSSNDEFPAYWVREDGTWKVNSDQPKPCDTNTSLGGGSSTRTPATGPGSSRAEAVKIGTAVRAGDAEYTVLNVNLDANDVITRTDFPPTPVADRRFVLVRVRVKAVGTGEKTVDVDASKFSMTGSGNKVYEAYSDDASCGFSLPDELDAKLFPNGEAEGNICLSVPRGETRLILIVQPEFSFDGAGNRYLALE